LSTHSHDAFWTAYDGRRYPVEDGVVRMLDTVNPELAAELAAQEAALDVYLDETQLMTLYERKVTRVAVGEMLGAVPAGAAILDVGCGVGVLGRLYPHFGMVGVDASFPLLRQAKAGYSLRLECTADKLPFPDAAFDAVLAINMLHHVLEPAVTTAEFARVLKPGGVLIAVDPREVRPVELAKKLLRRGDAAYADSHRAFKKDEYADLLRAGGALRLEELRPFGLLALLGGGGLDALHLSKRLPNPSRTLSALDRADGVLARVPGLARAGLNLAARARKR
jgi:ubiquinone/menaquinone biosynthesis C-methylase UbiE